MSTTNEEDSVQEVTTKNEVTNVAATETSMEEKDGGTGNETTTTTTMKKEDDLEDDLEDDGDECDSRAPNVLRQIDDTEREQAARNSDAITCAACGQPQTSARILNNCSCRSVRYCNNKCQKKHRKKHAKECRRLIAEKTLKEKTTDMDTTPPVSTSDTSLAATETISNDEEGSQKEEEDKGERKEDKDVTTAADKLKPQNEMDEEGDKCPICLELLSKDATKFSRFACCGNGIHNHCLKDMQNMNMSGTCPFCRAKTPTSDEGNVKNLHPWVKKKKAWAQNLMGQQYKKGEGVKQSFEISRELFELAAEQGDANAMLNLGNMYRYGQSVEQSYERAVEYFEQAAVLGQVEAQFTSGLMYKNGHGVKQSFEIARELFELAAEQGDANAMLNLGNMYRYGQGVEESYKRAKEYYQQANDAAQHNLGNINFEQQAYWELYWVMWLCVMFLLHYYTIYFSTFL
jgi:TPR repeat protein